MKLRLAGLLDAERLYHDDAAVTPVPGGASGWSRVISHHHVAEQRTLTGP
jgi:hypothetical protein